MRMGFEAFLKTWSPAEKIKNKPFNELLAAAWQEWLAASYSECLLTLPDMATQHRD